MTTVNRGYKLCSPLTFTEILIMDKFERKELGESIGWAVVVAGSFVGWFVVVLLSFFEG